MRYIKSFNESKDFLDYSEFIRDIEDILLPISDLDYNIKVELVKDYVYHIFIRIIQYGDNFLNFTKNIEDELDRLYDFTEENGFKIDKVYYKKVRPDGRIFNKGEREVSNYEYFKKETRGSKLAFLSIELKQVKR
jgi:hypothetical protein